MLVRTADLTCFLRNLTQASRRSDRNYAVPTNAGVDPDWVPVTLDWGSPSIASTLIDTVKVSASSSKVKLWYKKANNDWAQPPAAGWSTSSVVDSVPATIYVEGMTASASPRDVTITMEGFCGIASVVNAVKVSVIQARMDIDSKNDSAFAPDAHTPLDAEDLIEDSSTLPGKYIAVNEDDSDNDGVADFADGYTTTGGVAAGGATANDNFVPLKVDFAGVDPTKAVVRITYGEVTTIIGVADPRSVTRTGTGTASDPYVYSSGGGKFRIWKRDGNQARSGEPVGVGGGDWIESGGTYKLSDLGISGTSGTLWIEAVGASTALGSLRILTEIDPDGVAGPAVGFMKDDAVRLTAITSDVDVDSDNNSGSAGYDAPARSALEDAIESTAKDGAAKDHIGKVVLVNDGDLDGDGILDYSDGFDADSGIAADDTPPTLSQGERFVPVTISIPAPIDLSVARLQIDYDASVPGVGPGGSLRLWTKDGYEARSKNPFTTAGGNYVPKKSGTDHYAPADITVLGFSNSVRDKQLFIEGIAPSTSPGDKVIKFSIDPDGAGPAEFVTVDVVHLTTIRVDLDVNKNSSLDDAVDRTVNYLPGYEGATPKVSTGTTFNTAAYTGQEMKLMVQGLGTGTVVDEIKFKLSSVSSEAGYSGNVSDPKVEGSGKLNDFSFVELADKIEEVGTMAAAKTAVPIWAKDYGASAIVTVEAKIGASTFTLREFSLPNDSDGDRVADSWERAKVTEWNTQFGATEVVGPAFFGASDDTELKDPDGTTDALGFVTPTAAQIAAGTPANIHEHATVGDGRTLFNEYRGYVLDGGGFDWSGGNPHSGGHTRLNPAYRELLIEVDSEDGIVALPAATRAGIVVSWLDLISKGTSQAIDGAGFRTFYAIDNLATVAHGSFATQADLYAYEFLQISIAGFKHLQLVAEFVWGSAGQTWPGYDAGFAVDTAASFLAGPGGWNGHHPTLAAFASSYISHELHHTYAWSLGTAAPAGTHLNDTNGNGTPNEADDMDRVLFDYAPSPAGYRGQDYIKIKYGRGSTRFIDLK